MAIALVVVGPRLNPAVGLSVWLGTLLGIIVLAAVIYQKYGSEYRVTSRGVARVWRWPSPREQEIAWENLGEVLVLRGLTQTVLQVGNLAFQDKAGGSRDVLVRVVQPQGRERPDRPEAAVMEPEAGWEAAAAVPEPDRRSPAPWEDPEASTLAGLFRTLREVLFRPGEFFENLGGEGWAEPLAFALIVSSVGLLAACFWQFLILAPAGGNPGDAAGLSPSLGLSPGWLMALMAASPVLALVNLGVSGICWWGSVALVRAGREFIPAWRILCYAQGGMALALIPVLRHVGSRNLGPGPAV